MTDQAVFFVVFTQILLNFLIILRVVNLYSDIIDKLTVYHTSITETFLDFMKTFNYDDEYDDDEDCEEYDEDNEDAENCSEVSDQEGEVVYDQPLVDQHKDSPSSESSESSEDDGESFNNVESATNTTTNV